MIKKSSKKGAEVKYKKWLLSILFLTVSIILAVCAYFILVNDTNEKAAMEGYLRERYGQEFVVENPRITGAGFAVKGSLRADAYPEDDPSLRFELRKPQDASSKDGYDYDSFLSVLWSRQGLKEAEEFASSLGGVRATTLEIRTGMDFTSTLHQRTPSFEEVRSQDERVFSYSLSIASRAEVSDREPSDAQLNRAFKMVEFVKLQRAVDSELHYTYGGEGSGLPDKYIISVKGNDALASIHKPEDLKQYFDLTYAAKQE